MNWLKFRFRLLFILLHRKIPRLLNKRNSAVLCVLYGYKREYVFTASKNPLMYFGPSFIFPTSAAVTLTKIIITTAKISKICLRKKKKKKRGKKGKKLKETVKIVCLVFFPAL